MAMCQSIIVYLPDVRPEGTWHGYPCFGCNPVAGRYSNIDPLSDERNYITIRRRHEYGTLSNRSRFTSFTDYPASCLRNIPKSLLALTGTHCQTAILDQASFLTCRWRSGGEARCAARVSLFITWSQRGLFFPHRHASFVAIRCMAEGLHIRCIHGWTPFRFRRVDYHLGVVLLHTHILQRADIPSFLV